MCVIFWIILIHVARKARAAAAELLPKQRQCAFTIYVTLLPRIDITGHSRAPPSPASPAARKKITRQREGPKGKRQKERDKRRDKRRDKINGRGTGRETKMQPIAIAWPNGASEVTPKDYRGRWEWRLPASAILSLQRLGEHAPLQAFAPAVH